MERERILLKCGCVANAIRTMPDGTQKPSCVIHECDEPIEKVDLEGRKAKCKSCGKIVDSSYDLAFFQLNGDDSSAPQNLLNIRNATLRSYWKMKDDHPDKTETKKMIDHLNKEIHRLITRDSYYCGCNGWD